MSDWNPYDALRHNRALMDALSDIGYYRAQGDINAADRAQKQAREAFWN